MNFFSSICLRILSHCCRAILVYKNKSFLYRIQMFARMCECWIEDAYGRHSYECVVWRLEEPYIIMCCGLKYSIRIVLKWIRNFKELQGILGIFLIDTGSIFSVFRNIFRLNLEQDLRNIMKEGRSPSEDEK